MTGDLILMTLMHPDPSGSDPLEADVRLPFLPRKNDSVAVWVSKDTIRAVNPSCSYLGDNEFHLDVTEIILHSYAPERIVVYVRRSDGTSDDELRAIFKALERNEQP